MEKAQENPKTWGEMTPEEQGALLLAHHNGEVIELCEVTIGMIRWMDAKCPYWSPWTAYRVKPKPPTKPSINWDHVSDKYNYLVENKSGGALLSNARPTERHYGFWQVTGGSVGTAKTFASYKPGTCDWKDSLVCRPGFEDTLEDK